jgi:hypothetical protein
LTSGKNGKGGVAKRKRDRSKKLKGKKREKGEIQIRKFKKGVEVLDFLMGCESYLRKRLIVISVSNILVFH